MSNLECISRLYRNVLFREIAESGLSDSEVRDGIRTVNRVYYNESTTFDACTLELADFGDPACRCAYLHKYSPLHTYVVLDAMLKILRADPGLFRHLLADACGCLEMCSLGGGARLRRHRGAGRPKGRVRPVRLLRRHRGLHGAVAAHLRVRPARTGVGAMWGDVDRHCDYDYIEHNLLRPMTNEVNRAVAAASLVSMVKFVSAAACADTENMVDKIFRVMKVGALVLYIDNAAGGFTQLIERSGKKNGLVPVAGPFKHVHYNAEALRIVRFGYTSCYQTKVTIILLQKVLNPSLNREVPLDPSHLQSEPKPPKKKKLDFIVFDNCWDNSSDQTVPLDVNLFSPKLNTSAADSKCIEKYPEKLNNHNVSPVKKNASRTLQDSPGMLEVVGSPRKPFPVSPSKSNIEPPQNPNRISPPGPSVVVMSPRKPFPVSPPKSNIEPPQNPNRVSPRIANFEVPQKPPYSPRGPQPVSRSPAVAQRYMPVSTAERNVPPEEEDSEEAPCCCCVVS